MTTSQSDITENYYIWPALLAILNFCVLLPAGLIYMSHTAELWDYIFVAAGCYFAMKFVRYVSKAHQYKEARIDPKYATEIIDKGIYKSVRHPVAAGVLYMNVAYVLLFRAMLLIPMVPVFFALWVALAQHKDNLMIEKFGDNYRDYMERTAMFRGGSEHSGYEMY